VEALRSGSGTLLNEYDWGGFLIYRVPERKVFVDGRLFPFYPAVLADYRDAIELRPNWKDVLARYDVREVLLMPNKALAVALREDGWKVRAEGPSFVLLAKP
jgi:cation diffusion facilitator CzcD-associated flavoprotein CzcO